MSTSFRKALRVVMTLTAALAPLACSTTATVPRTPAERASDQALVKQVEAAMAKDPYVDTDHVSVDSRRGIVRLKGQLETPWDLRRVLQIATAVPGVVRVDDDIEIMNDQFGRTARQ